MHSDLEQKLVSIRNEIDRENEMIRDVIIKKTIILNASIRFRTAFWKQTLGLAVSKRMRKKSATNYIRSNFLVL